MVSKAKNLDDVCSEKTYGLRSTGWSKCQWMCSANRRCPTSQKNLKIQSGHRPQFSRATHHRGRHDSARHHRRYGAIRRGRDNWLFRDSNASRFSLGYLQQREFDSDTRSGAANVDHLHAYLDRCTSRSANTGCQCRSGGDATAIDVAHRVYNIRRDMNQWRCVPKGLAVNSPPSWN